MSIVDILKSNDSAGPLDPVEKPAPSLKVFETSVQKFVSSWPGVVTYQDYLRASEFYFICPREFVLNYWQPKSRGGYELSGNLMMGLGSFLHSYLQDQVLGPMGVLRGDWKNQDTGELVVDSYHPDPEKAVDDVVNQRPVTWRYVEFRVWDSLYRLSGHIDGVVSLDRVVWLNNHFKLIKSDPVEAFRQLQLIDPGEECLLEIKTSGTRVFDRTKTVSEVAPYYKSQAIIYQKLKGVPKTLFWFISRDTMKNRLFLYEYDDKWWIDITTKSRIIFEAIRDETLPDLFMACKAPTDRRAKGCPHREDCWTRKFNFTKYVADGKSRADQEGRQLLDLANVIFP